MNNIQEIEKLINLISIEIPHFKQQIERKIFAKHTSDDLHPKQNVQRIPKT